MTEDQDRPNLDDVEPATEETPRTRREHGKAPQRLDDDDLARRAEQERIEAGINDYDPEDVPPAAE